MDDHHRKFRKAHSERMLHRMLIQSLLDSLKNIQMMSNEYQAIHKEKFPEIEISGEVPHIAQKPLLVLATYANNDLPIIDVASKLCISPVTAHQQIADARKALNKKTNIGAIKEAVRQGLISYDYE